MVVEGCTISKVPVDGGFGVNLILEDTAFNFRIHLLRSHKLGTPEDQSRVLPMGRLSQVPTVIREVTYLLNYVVIQVSSGRSFPLLLEGPGCIWPKCW